MPYTDNSIQILTNINVYGDLRGPILSPYVFSIGNVTDGILSIRNGGTGTTAFPENGILVGGLNQLRFIVPDLQNDGYLSWSTSDNQWTLKQIYPLNKINFDFIDNPIFSSSVSTNNGELSVLVNSKQIETGNFLAAATDNSGILVSRKIQQEDLPLSLSNLDISESNFFGNFSGSYSGSFFGDGSQITNIDTANIPLLFDFVKLLIPNNLTFSQIDNNLFLETIDGISTLKLSANLTNVDSVDTNILNVNTLNAKALYLDTAEIGLVSGKFLGDGSGITNISSTNLDYNYFIFDGQRYNLGSEINLNNYFKDLTVNSVSGTFYGNGANITDIRASSLDYNYLTINGKNYSLGESLEISTGIDNINLSNSNLSGALNYSTSGSSLDLGLSNNLVLNSIYVSSSLTASELFSNNIFSERFDGTFYGNGSNITEILAQNILNLDDYIAGTIIIDQQNIIFNEFQEISLNQNLQINSITASVASLHTASITTASIDNLYAKNLSLENFSANEISASSLYGNGQFVYNISADSISNFNQKVLSIYQAGDGIDIIGNTIFAKKQDFYITSIIPGNNLLGGGIVGDITISLNDDIYVNSVSASTVASNYFSGNGGGIYNLNAEYINNLQEVIKLCISGGVGISVNNGIISSTLPTASYATTASLVNYATIASVASTYLAKTDLTSSARSAFSAGTNISIVNGVISATAPSSGVSGIVPVVSGGTGIGTLVPGALYVAETTSSLAPLTGSEFSVIAWDSAANKWNHYTQPYDIAFDSSGFVPAGTEILTFTVPRKIKITSIVSATPMNIKVDGQSVTSYPKSINAGSTIKCYTINDSLSPSGTIVGNLI